MLTSLIMMNIEGEGIQDVNEYYRKKLVMMGVLPPTDEERQAMAAAAEQQGQPTPQDTYFMAEAQKIGPRRRRRHRLTRPLQPRGHKRPKPRRRKPSQVSIRDGP